ncbi:VirB3 family type IV secretion system protein [Granulicella arctica]|uniref:VirB3 family type IV secretion system protein n=1 Tax=Granulicella arctica TaxID=940613 RepID=UPI0021E048E1|nr:VirB3 family type IV secretion system protein [Granulicella arctica]
MTKRGEALPINQAMNRSRTKLGLELSAWMAIVFVSVSVFLVGFRMLAVISLPWSDTICTSVVLFATLGLMEMNRLATCPPSNTQLDVSPPNTVATFSSAGNKIRVD